MNHLRAIQGGSPPVTRRPSPGSVRYNQLWSLTDKKRGTRYLRITSVGNSRAEGYTWWESENGGRVTRILKQTIATKWTLLRDDSPGGAA